MKRRELGAFTSVSVEVSFEGTQSAELPDLLTIIPQRDVGKGSSHTELSHLNVSKLLGVAIAFESCVKRLKAFRDFADLILKRFKMSVITNTQLERSFVFGYKRMVKVRTFSFCFILFFFMFDT